MQQICASAVLLLLVLGNSELLSLAVLKLQKAYTTFRENPSEAEMDARPHAQHVNLTSVGSVFFF
jgi:hypothetical protein